MSVPSLSASLKEKQKRDYNVQLDIEVRNWVSVFLGEKIDLSPATSFGTIFKDGVLLCQIINKIQPGLIPEPARSPLAFKQMENIQNYLNGCRQLGLPQSSLFNTIDLFEEKNLNLVVSNVFNICHLARGTRFSSDRDSATSIAAHKQKQKPGVASLSSSASVHQDNRRKGSLVGSALTSSASTIENKSKLTVPPRVTPPRAASTPLHRDPARDAPPPGPTPTPPKPTTPTPPKPTTPTPPKPTPTLLKATTPVLAVTAPQTGDGMMKRIRKTSFNKCQSEQIISSSLSATWLSARTQASAKEPIRKAQSSADVSSLTDDINAKAAFKYNPILEEQAQRWVCSVLGIMPDPTRSFISSIKDGVLLCRLINKLQPNTIPQVHTSSVAYKQMENIAAYLKACVRLGLSPSNCFNTVDLYEEKDINLVINNIHMLAKHVKASGIGGPNVPIIEDSKRARRAYSIFLTEVQGLQELRTALNDQEMDSEEKELVLWVNSHISKDGGPLITNAHADLKDGVVLIRLLEVLSETKVGHYVADPKIPWHRIQNAALILRFISEQTFYSEQGCTSHDIVLGKSEPLKTLLKHIRAKFDRDFLFQGMEEDTRRQKIAEELVSTERTYVTLLRSLVEGLLREIKSRVGQLNEILTQGEIDEVFANVEEIVQFHDSLLSAFDARLASYSPLTQFGDIFVNKFKGDFVQMYQRYARDFDSIHLVIKYLKGVKPEFRGCIDKFESEEKNRSGLLLNSFLILPIQRVPRYMLLLQELEKHTPKEHLDGPNLKQAINQLEITLDDMNDSKTKSDSQNKLSTIESSLAGLDKLPIDTLVHPKRRYVREGALVWQGESEDNPSPYFFLFNDFLMYTQRKEESDEGGKAFEYITVVPLNFITNVEESQAEANAFQIGLEEELTIFIAPSAKERDEWVKDIQKAMDEKVVIQFCDF